MEILYFLQSQSGECFKVGITNNIENRLKSIESTFGKINSKESFIYSCNNRKLIEKIEFGIHAYLSNHVHHPRALGGGSTEWFNVEAKSKFMFIASTYINEINVFKLESTLDEFIKKPVNHALIIASYDNDMDFYKAHQSIIDSIEELIKKSINKVSYRKESGKYFIKNLEINNFTLGNMPSYEWVKINNDELEFDMVTINKWKSNGNYKELRSFIEEIFFNEYRYKNIKTFYNTNNNQNAQPYQTVVSANANNNNKSDIEIKSNSKINKNKAPLYFCLFVIFILLLYSLS